MRRIRVDRTMAAWGIVFGVLATLTGVFLLEAVEGGCVAGGWVLGVVCWAVGLVRVVG